MGDKAGAPAAAGGGNAADRVKIPVYVGNAKVSIKKADGTVDKNNLIPVILWIRKGICDALNFTEAPADKMSKVDPKDADNEIFYTGCKHGRTVIIVDPTGKKADAKGAAGGTGKSIKTYSFQIPGYCTRKLLRKWLAPTKAKAFRIAGGNKVPVGTSAAAK